MSCIPKCVSQIAVLRTEVRDLLVKHQSTIDELLALVKKLEAAAAEPVAVERGATSPTGPTGPA